MEAPILPSITAFNLNLQLPLTYLSLYYLLCFLSLLSCVTSVIRLYPSLDDVVYVKGKIIFLSPGQLFLGLAQLGARLGLRNLDCRTRHVIQD